MTTDEKARRDAEVIRDRVRGLSWERIAQRHNLTERQCRNIWAAHIQQIPLEKPTLRDALVEAILQLDATIEDLSTLIETTQNDPVKLGAIKGTPQGVFANTGPG